MKLLKLAIPAVCLASACAVPDDTSKWAREAAPAMAARNAMIGMDQTDVRMCAGFPTARTDEGVRGEIWSFKNASDQGNLNISLPSFATGPLQGGAGAIGLSSSGSCSVQVRFEDARVVQVEYAGDNNTPNSINAMCVPIVDSCVVYADKMKTAP